MEYGDPSLPERFWSKVSIADTGCWIWTGEVAGSRSHYGRFMVLARRVNRKEVRVQSHRATYAAANGPIPDGMEVDHLCKVRLCCNPAHLEAVTGAVNRARSSWTPRTMQSAETIAKRSATKRAWTHCRKGHEYTPETTSIENGRRRCIRCRLAKDRKRRPIRTRPRRLDF